MRFKIDENLPVEVALLLRNAGHDAATLYDQSMVGVADDQLAKVCQSEGRVIMTLDLDFADIRAYSPAQYSGIIVLRPSVQSVPKITALIQSIIPLLETELLKGCLWIAQESGVRIRGSE